MRNTDNTWIERLITAFQRTTDEDELRDTMHQGTRKMESLNDAIPSGLRKLWADLRLMLQMLADYFKGKYTGVPWPALCAIGFGIAYFVMPIDAMPDWIPFVGYLDDTTVLGFVVKMVRDELDMYRAWRSRKDNTMDVCCN